MTSLYQEIFRDTERTLAPMQTTTKTKYAKYVNHAECQMCNKLFADVVNFPNDSDVFQHLLLMAFMK